MEENSPLLNNNPVEFDNISTDSIKECWICKEIVDTHIKFCECDGYISYVHKECLNTWINTSKKTTCDFCETSYKFNYEYDYDNSQYISKIIPNVFVLIAIIILCILTFVKDTPLYINSYIIWLAAIFIIIITIKDFLKFNENIRNESRIIVLVPYD
tara:strand:+ start:144 stop:614 length:471 start_codon:yes stop_codon:yes gene_type:complete